MLENANYGQRHTVLDSAKLEFLVSCILLCVYYVSLSYVSLRTLILLLRHLSCKLPAAAAAAAAAFPKGCPFGSRRILE